MKLKPIKPQQLIKLLGLVGYSPVRQKGSHLILEHQESKKITIIPIHSKDLGVGLLSMILREVGLSRDDYFKKLKDI